jgi:hypothetical protein
MDPRPQNSIVGIIKCIQSIEGAFGCMYNMWLAEHFGRKRSIQMTYLLVIVAAALMTGPVNIPLFVVN